MRSKFAVLIILLLSIYSVISVEVEDHVLVLDDKNFDEELKNHESLLLEFYAPWCGHCKSLAPEYAKAAEILSKENPPLHVAKIDATENTELAKRFEIQGFPTLKFYKNGSYSDYDGARTAESIVRWVKKKTGPVVRHIQTEEELKNYREQNDVYVVYYGEPSHANYPVFESVAELYDDILFSHTTLPSQHSGQVVLYKNFDEGFSVFNGDVDKSSLVSFIELESVPLISNFDERLAEFIFGKNKAALFLFRSKETEHLLDDLLIRVARKYKGKLYFTKSGIVGDMEERLAEYYGLTQGSLPQVRITDVKSDEDVKNYVLEGEITEHSIDNFVSDFLEGKLSPHYKSEEVPETQTGNVYKVVSKTFKEVVASKDDYVLLELYAPWCPHCKEFESVYERIGEYFKNNDKVLIAKMDATANEVEGLVVHGYPTLLLFKPGDKENPLEYDGEREYWDLINFVEELADPETYKRRQEEKAAQQEQQPEEPVAEDNNLPEGDDDEDDEDEDDDEEGEDDENGEDHDHEHKADL
jgi:protein disulfide-isomerase A1